MNILTVEEFDALMRISSNNGMLGLEKQGLSNQKNMDARNYREVEWLV